MRYTTIAPTAELAALEAAPLGVLDLVVVTPVEWGARPFHGEIVVVRDGAYLVSYRCGRSREWFPAHQVRRRPRRYLM